MQKKIKGIALIVCGIAAIIAVKMLDMPAVVSVLLVIVGLGMFVVGLALALPAGSAAPDKDKAT